MAGENHHMHSTRERAHALLQGNRLADALPLYQEMCRADHTDADAWLVLGVIYGRLGDAALAEKALQRAAHLRPAHVATLYNLGIALRDAGRVTDSVSTFRRVLELEPRHVGARYLLAQGFEALGKLEDAATSYAALRDLTPDNPAVHARLGICLHSLGRLEDAVSCYRAALATGGQDANTQDNLAAALSQQGRSMEAVAVHRETLAAQPENAHSHSNLLLALHYLPARRLDGVFEEHRRWGRIHGADPGGVVPPFPNRPEPERRLHVGYVSPDFCEHSVSYFFEPLLANHRDSLFEITCYSATRDVDTTTARLRSLAHRWRDIADVDDRRVVDMVRNDEIDILVDLAGHTGGSRLTVFADRPAPIQVSYLGYPDTTGLPAIGYRLCDGITDPEGCPIHCTEELVRLSGCFLCYRPPAQAPHVAPPPAEKHGYVTFGSFNNLAKINEEVVATWSALLHEVPHARLVLKSAFLADRKTGERYLRQFAQCGIQGERIKLLGRAPTTSDHLEMYRYVDVALDTFPYNGATTTCEALWMGVPVVTLTGDSHAGRVGKSLLTAVELGALAADSREEYVAIAARLVGEPGRLATVRGALRDRMETSILCDGVRFAGVVEHAYRTMWRRWCTENTHVDGVP